MIHTQQQRLLGFVSTFMDSKSRSAPRECRPPRADITRESSHAALNSKASYYVRKVGMLYIAESRTI